MQLRLTGDILLPFLRAETCCAEFIRNAREFNCRVCGAHVPILFLFCDQINNNIYGMHGTL